MIVTKMMYAHTTRDGRGFTLVELLIAIVLLALLSVLAWRSVDGMYRTQGYSQKNSDKNFKLQTALTQWRLDLQHIRDTNIVNTIAFDGQVFRVTRRDPLNPGAVRVVAWALSNTQDEEEGGWLRWQSTPVYTRDNLRNAWADAKRWAQQPLLGNNNQEEAKQHHVMSSAFAWEIFFFRNNAWTNPQSSDIQTHNNNSNQDTNKVNQETLFDTVLHTPDAVRLRLYLDAGESTNSVITADWLNPSDS
jgi:general secretion pathway protein J